MNSLARHDVDKQEAGRELLGRSGVVVAGPTADDRPTGVLAAGGEAVRADLDRRGPQLA